MNAVAALAATDERAGAFVDALWDTQIPSGKWRYYDGMLYALALLHASGHFRIYPPS
jgi:oligosaccharide reducing-end xylanase